MLGDLFCTDGSTDNLQNQPSVYIKAVKKQSGKWFDDKLVS